MKISVRLRNHFSRHGRFYISVLLGIAAWFAAEPAGLAPAVRLLAAGDIFFLSYLVNAAVRDTGMRRATLGHSVVSFFYNTAIIAMAVNAAVAMAS